MKKTRRAIGYKVGKKEYLAFVCGRPTGYILIEGRAGYANGVFVADFRNGSPDFFAFRNSMKEAEQAAYYLHSKYSRLAQQGEIIEP